jgi:hypothetical protein
MKVFIIIALVALAWFWLKKPALVRRLVLGLHLEARWAPSPRRLYKMTVAARTVGGQARGPQKIPANKE